ASSSTATTTTERPSGRTPPTERTLSPGPSLTVLSMDTREDSASGDIGSWRNYGPSTLPKPLEAALEAFAERGYDGTSIREIAARAGLSVPGLYHHYPS